MPLDHGQALEPIDVRPLGSAWADACSTSLLKSQRVQLMRLVLRRGESLPEHHVPGEMTLQCIEGEASIGTPTRQARLHAGEVLLLPGGMAHTVTAQADTSLLVTLLLEPEAPPREKSQTLNQRKGSTEEHPR